MSTIHRLRIFTHFVIRLSIDCRNSDSVYYIDSCSCNCNTAQTGKGSRHLCSIKLIPEATNMKMSRDVIQILVLVHSLHTFTGRKSISIQLQNSGKLRRKRFISRRSVRLEIFSTIFFFGFNAFPLKLNTNCSQKNTDTMPRSGSGDRERERRDVDDRFGKTDGQSRLS